MQEKIEQRKTSIYCITIIITNGFFDVGYVFLDFQVI